MLFDAPRTAVGKLLERTGMELGDFDLIEVNEAFAAQVLANGKALDWDWNKVNIRGGAIAWVIRLERVGRGSVSLIHSLRQSNLETGLAVICHAGGWGSGDKRGGHLVEQRDLQCRRWRKIRHPPRPAHLSINARNPKSGLRIHG